MCTDPKEKIVDNDLIPQFIDIVSENQDKNTKSIGEEIRDSHTEAGILILKLRIGVQKTRIIRRIRVKLIQLR